MQRVAIFRFNRGKQLALLLLLAFSVLIVSLFMYNTRAHADTATTYSTETSSNIETKIKALKYYATLKWCTQSSGNNWKTTITGSDIDKGPRWWINGSGGASNYIGLYIDSWGDKNGITGCNGENDSQPGWVNDMFDVFGLSLDSDKQTALKSLGYKCSNSGSDVSCTNNDINSTTSKNGILYQVLHGPYLNGVNPLSLQPDDNAMAYFLALNALTTNSECNAVAGGSSNLVTVSEVQPDGSIKKGSWGIKNDGGTTRPVISGVPIIDDFGAGDPTCGDMAKDTVKYAADYAAWSGKSACATANPDQATDQNFLYACAQGRVNPTNYSMCVTVTWSDDASINYEMKNACFIGQGLPIDPTTGTSSGMLCYEERYTDTSSLTACIKGSLNQSTATYCTTTYPPPDTIPPKPTPPDTLAPLRAACMDGQKLNVSGGGIPGDTTITQASAAGTSGTSCGIEGIGWIVCPVISFMGSMLASAFSGLADNFLSTDVSLFSTSSGTYVAWAIFRNIANVVFVIAFLIIIFSQLTGVGVTNYGVKKLLPRIVIAAILVNLSYFICQIAVDLSNILGYSLKQVFDGIATKINVPTSTDASGNGFGIAAIIVAVIATATVAYFALSILIPILLGALIGVLMVVLMLIARKAIIVLLIVLSPLAFVAFLLPNTESLFTKWRKAFMALLLLFPIISVVFGMSSLASQIILNVGPTGGESQTTLQIVAVGIAALPFFLVPTLLKGSLNGIGSVGGKLSSFASKAGGNLGKAGSGAFGNSRLGQFQKYRQGARNVRRAQIQSGTYTGGGLRGLASKANGAVNNRSGVFGTRLTATGISAAAEDSSKNTKAAAISLNAQAPSREKLRDIRKTTQDGAMRKAAVERMVQTNDITGMNEMLEDSHTWSAEDRIHLADTLGSASNRPAYVGQGDLAALRDSTNKQQVSTKALVKKAVDANAYSAAKVAGGDGDELTFVAKTVAEIGGDTQAKIAASAQEALADERLAPTIGKNLAQVENLSRHDAPTDKQLEAIK